jgi:hypothetical protein
MGGPLVLPRKIFQVFIQLTKRSQIAKNELFSRMFIVEGLSSSGVIPSVATCLPVRDANELLLIRVPIYTLAIYPTVSTLKDHDSFGQILLFEEGIAEEQSQIAWRDKFAFTHNQERHLAYRVMHHLLRVSGCDFGWTSFRAFSFLSHHYRDWIRTLGFRDA